MYHVGNRDRFYLDYEDIPMNMINAIVSAEDKTFFQHQGFDIKGIANAFIINLKIFILKIIITMLVLQQLHNN